MVRFSCPTCGQHFAGDESYYGRQLNCPACRNPFTVPSPAPADHSAPPPIPHYAPNTLPPNKNKTALMVTAGVLMFLLSAGAAFLVVQRLLAPQAAAIASAPAHAANKSTPATAKTPQQSASDDSAVALSASDIIQRVNDAYSSLTSYSTEGTVVTDMDISQMDMSKIPNLPPQVAAQMKNSKEARAALAKPQHVEAEFSVKLSKPNFYRVDWKSQHGPMHTSGATWSAGNGDYLYMEIGPPKYVKMQNRDMAIGAATGLSQGAAYTVPSFFFKTNQTFLDRMENVALGADENVDGADCYVLNGELQGLKLNLWIDKSTFFIKQKQQVLGGPIKLPKISDQDVDTALKQLGTGATPEKRAQMKAMMQNMKTMSSKMKGTITETYRKIEANQRISADQFNYDVPKGVELRSSLF